MPLRTILKSEMLKESVSPVKLYLPTAFLLASVNTNETFGLDTISVLTPELPEYVNS